MLDTPLIVAIVVAIYLFSSIHVLTEYERGVIFRLGKLLPQTKGPGVILVFRPIAVSYTHLTLPTTPSV